MMKRKYFVLISLIAVIAVSFAITSTLFGSEPKHLTVVAFGDSNTAGSNWTLERFPSESKWLARLSAKMPQYTFINKGIGGNTTERGLKRFDRDVLAEKPDIVLIMFGTNDSRLNNGNAMVSKQRFQENIERLILTSKQNHIKPVLMTTIPIINTAYRKRHPEINRRTNPRNNNEKYNELTRQIASVQKVRLIDLNQIFINKAGGANDTALLASGLLDSSGTHMSPKGAEAAANKIYKVLEKMN